MSASNLNANFDYTYNHTQKSNSKDAKKALPLWKSNQREGINKCDRLYGQMLVVGEILMFIGEYISQLVREALSVAYLGINISMRVSVYPIVNAAVSDIVLQFYGERPVCLAALKLGVEHTE